MNKYETVLLVRLGELALKGLNRGKFEAQLVRNLRHRLKQVGDFSIYRDQSRVYVKAKSEAQDFDMAAKAATDVFGLVSVSIVRMTACTEEAVRQHAMELVTEALTHVQHLSFKVETRRISEYLVGNSYDISARLGEYLLEMFPDCLKVDVHTPELTVHVELREEACLYTQILPGCKGLPVGMGGRGMLLLSGGIDSPVAGWMMASRGMELDAIYFHTAPYTSEAAKQKVVDLATILTRYVGTMRLHVVDFTDIQLKINATTPHDMITIIMRRVMMRIANAKAAELGCKAIITGESLGQVASQTLEAIVVTDQASEWPVFRPLIGIDKDDTTKIARRIGTFETSILPYEDCCTVFVAKHPQTHPNQRQTERAEVNLDIESLVADGMAKIETIQLPLP